MKLLGSGLVAIAILAGGMYTFRDRIAGWASRLEPATQNQVSAEQIVLTADSNDGASPEWEKRYYYGEHTWGIRGSGKPEEGRMWFDSFPGETGRYRVTLGAIFEADGSPHFSLSADDRTLYEGRLPYHGGEKDCEARGAVQDLELGDYKIAQGSKISLWGKAVYECGEKGAYMLWHELRFERLQNP